MSKIVGKKVRLTKNMAEWYLEHPEHFYAPNDTSNEFDEDHLIAVQMATEVLLGGRIVGTIQNDGWNKNEYRVKFVTPYGEYNAYYEHPRDINFIKE
jgi:hypothetical protein